MSHEAAHSSACLHSKPQKGRLPGTQLVADQLYLGKVDLTRKSYHRLRLQGAHGHECSMDTVL